MPDPRPQSAAPPLSAAAPHASAFARVALENIRKEYPNKLDHVLNDPAELLSPRQLHPAFYGSFDWHSCVHMHWTLARLLRLFPDLPEAPQIIAALDAHLTPDNVGGEIAYLQQPSRTSFERTYGWAWLLKLHTELIRLASVNRRAEAWRDALQPLADVFVQRYLDFLPLTRYPIRAGTHANSAFGLLFALDYAECTQHLALRRRIEERANTWFGRDRRYPAAYEPGDEDFLSPGLMEAALMMRVVDGCSYVDWWEVFCPLPQDLQGWLTPVMVADRSDFRLAHLDGLNLARAWCWKSILPSLPLDMQAPVLASISAHIVASLPYACHGNYAGTHWLSSFALLALTEDE